jgi:hypothetical protein
MRFVFLALYLLPTVAVVVLGWFVVRAITIRVVWRENDVRRFDDEAA